MDVWKIKTATGYTLRFRGAFLEDALAAFRREYPHVAILSIEVESVNQAIDKMLEDAGLVVL